MKVLEIKKEDLQSNIDKIKARAGKTKIIAVVKGNGYGLGLRELSEFLIKNGINDLAVSSVEEAIELSKMNLEANIICLEATSIEQELQSLLAKNIVITIDNYECAKKLNELARLKKVKANVQIKIDTGFSRYGFLYTEKNEILKTITDCTNIFVRGVYSHFSSAYFKNEDFTKKQFNRFLEVKNFLEENNINIPMYHICNSSAFLKYDNMFLDAVRIGSAFLGRLSVKNNIGLKKIGDFKSSVADVREIKKNSFIGYSNSEKAHKDMKLAVIPVGYADGFHVAVQNDTFKFIDRLRILKNNLIEVFKKERIYVKINDKDYMVIGRVGMNHITIDITDSDVRVGDIVKLNVLPVLVNGKIRREYI